MPRTYKGLSPDINAHLNEVGMEKHFSEGIGKYFSLSFPDFFDEDDFEAILDTGALSAFGGNLGRINDNPQTTLLLYAMGTTGKNLKELEKLPREELRKIGHQMVAHVREHPMKLSFSDKNYLEFSKILMDGLEVFQTEQFPDIDYSDLSKLTTEQKNISLP